MLIKESILKAVKAFVLTIVFVLAFSLAEPELLYNDKIWLMILITIVASIFQPDYSPFKPASDDKDKGTALLIIWSVYISQALILSEAVFFEYEQSMSWSLVATIGAILAVIGLILRSWAYLELGDLFTWHISVQNEQKVVDTGPYRMVAHPGYSGALLTYTATGIMFQAWWATLASFLILFFVFKRRIEFEEKLLLGELGEDYRGFLHKRHKLLPPLY